MNINDPAWEKIVAVVVLSATVIVCSWLILNFFGVYFGAGQSPQDFQIQGVIPIEDSQVTIRVDCRAQTYYPTPADPVYECSNVNIEPSTLRLQTSNSINYGNYSNHVIVVSWTDVESGRQYHRNLTFTEQSDKDSNVSVSEVVNRGFIIRSPPVSGIYNLSVTIHPMLADSSSNRIRDNANEPITVYSEGEANTRRYQRNTFPFQALGALIALLAAGQFALRLWDRAKERQE